MVDRDFKKDINEMYTQDNERRQRLSNMVDMVLKGLKTLDQNIDAEFAEQLKQRIESETFKILIIGEFNTGKSTFINALMGAEILPTRPIPATAIINVLRYGEQPAVQLHFRDPEKDPMNIPVDKLGDYVLIKDSSGEEAARNEIRESPFSHAEVWWPLDLCRDNNVEIIDSPGLNESQVREEVTIDYLRKVDAVLFLMGATKFGPAQTEMATIDSLKAVGHQDFFFVINQWDLLRRQSDRDMVHGQAMKVLPTLTQRKDDIYFVSAADALDGRIEGDIALQKKSGFQPLENSLHSFLANERGRIKALRGARELRLAIRKLLDDSIPKKINLLKTPLADLQEKYDLAKKDLDRLKADKVDMVNFVARERTQIVSLAHSRVIAFFHTTENHINDWAQEYELDLAFSLNIKAQVELNAKKLGEFLTSKLTTSFKDWEKESLTPFIEDRIQMLYRELEVRAADFENHLNDAQFTLNGPDFQPVSLEEEFGPKSPLERILAAAGGWFVGGVGAGTIGAIFGWREMVKALLPNLAVIFTALTLGWSLLPFLAVTAAVTTITGKYSLKRIARQLKEKAAENFRLEVRKHSNEQADKIVKQLDEQLSALKDALETGMERQIAEVREQAESALADHQKGQDEVNNKLEQIETIKTEVNRVNTELDDFIMDLVNQKAT